MVAWLRKLLRPAPPEPAPPALPEPSPVLDAAQRSARAIAKLGLRLDQLESKVEGGFADLRAQLVASRSSAPTPQLPFELLFDAADLLDEAARLSPSPDHAVGLAGIRERLEQFLTDAGLRRVARLDGPLDPRLFRVVGREDDGVRPRVVRAAILAGERLVREGESILEPERKENAI